MTKDVINIIKDIIISLLILAVIILVVVVIGYDKSALATVIPTTESYNLTEQMQNDIEAEKIEEVQQVITTYYIDSKELKGYETTKEYDKGKKNPFAMESSSQDFISNETTTSNSVNNSQNFYDDDGTK